MSVVTGKKRLGSCEEVKVKGKRLRRWVASGWHWYVFALHPEAHYSSIL
jgi:hypothetical protein